MMADFDFRKLEKDDKEVRVATAMEPGATNLQSESLATSYERNTEKLLQRFTGLRAFSLELAAPLSAEDCMLQAVTDVSPVKWHLGHSTWFFEKFILDDLSQKYTCYNDKLYYIFNSYYKGAGEHLHRFHRGLLSHPPLKDVLAYRAEINGRIKNFFLALHKAKNDDLLNEALARLEIGLHHENQHQELILTDIKYNFFCNPLYPSYMQQPSQESLRSLESNSLSKNREELALRYVPIQGGLEKFGNDGKSFSYDNERPLHKVFVEDFNLANKTVTNYEYLQFIEAGGYQDFRLWLSDGWDFINKQNLKHPLYWLPSGKECMVFTLGGLKPLNLAEPVCHVNFFEADAYARWAGKRLPSEFEWELAFSKQEEQASEEELREQANFVEQRLFHPREARAGVGSKGKSSDRLYQMYGNTWEWTVSAYLPYPGFRMEPGVIGEYNGKFMNGQRVLKGGSVATSSSHIRRSYRNFFEASKSWQFSGIRLAE